MRTILVMIAAFLSIGISASALTPPKTISYQGYLKNSAGTPVNTTVNATFSLYSSNPPRNNRIWREIRSITPVNGIYSVALGEIVPIGLPFDVLYFLGVKIGSDPEMTPLQQLTSVPYALRALVAENFSNSAVLTTPNQIVSTAQYGTPPFQVASPTMVPNLNADMVDDKHADTFWWMGGNTGTGHDIFLGTTDNTPLNLGVNGTPALRIQPTSHSPNILGGYSGNSVAAAIYGATIAGGGSFFYENRVLQTFGTVGGGRNNHADGYGSTIAGGVDNQATVDYGVVAGGLHNYATGSSSGIGGGFYNVASGYVSYIGGGDLNEVHIQNGTIGGGYNNMVKGNQLTANSTIGGGVFNNLSSAFAATIAGGHGNKSTGEWASMGGGGFNKTSNRSTTISGGEYNVASGPGSTIGGGGWNGSASGGNQGSGTASTISGGFGNLITADGNYGTIGGGQQNQITAPAGTNLNIATIAGGYNNKVTLGGATVGGGSTNTAGGFDATVGGGNSNTASGWAAIVPGGNSNLAQGNTSFAAGYRAKAFNNGCFTWSDSNNFDFTCGADNAFTARATGGVYFVTGINGAGTATAGVQITPGGGSWGSLSDRNSKENLVPIDPREIVEKLALLPISTWNYRTQDTSIRHVGPMAQDFYATFGVGEDERHITNVDSEGVALAAIQGLYRIIKDKDGRIEALQQELEKLKQTIEERLARLERDRNAVTQTTAPPNVFRGDTPGGH